MFAESVCVVGARTGLEGSYQNRGTNVNQVVLTMRPIRPNEGDLLTLEEFRVACASCAFIDYDGIGDYATADAVSMIPVRPSDCWRTPPSPQLTHVVWYNR